MEIDHLAWLLGLGFTTCALGAGLSLLPAVPARLRLRLAHGLAAVGAAALAAAAAGTLLTGLTPDLGQFPLLPNLGGLHLRLDALSAFFLLLIGGVGAAGSLYAIGYTAGHQGTAAPAPAPALLGGMWNLFLISMAAVVMAADGLGFLLAWEAMSVVSFLLVVAEHHDPEVRRAGYFYVVMTHVGTAFLVGAFLSLYARTGSLDLAAFRAAAAGLPPGLRSGLFLLALVGFGTKAGLVPLHVWLPRAHPVAPSHVSALMSGVMVKTAVYGLLRFTLDVLGGGPPWWGGLLVTVAGISAVTGVLYATQQSHLKRLLAYSTVENVGLLCMGIGAALLARAGSQWDLSALALTAVLFHAVSHAAFKGLAFLCAGAVLHGAGTVDLERLGGLIRRMPQVALLFLTAALALAGLPPLSGFMGEWLTLHTFLHLAQTGPGLAERLGGLAALAAIALTAGLSAAMAVKAFGIAFLALPRSTGAAGAHEAPATMLAGMALPAAAVVWLGLLPGTALRLIRPVVTGLLPLAPAGQIPGSGGLLATLTVPAAVTAGHAGRPVAAAAGASLEPLAVTAAMVVLAGLILAATLALAGGRLRRRRGMTWTCGIEPDARMEYTGAGFSKPILLMFRSLLHPVRTLRVDPSEHPLFPGRVHYQSELTAIFELYLYRPVTAAVMAAASRLRRLQTGSLQVYLLYLLLTAVALLVAARRGG